MKPQPYSLVLSILVAACTSASADLTEPVSLGTGDGQPDRIVQVEGGGGTVCARSEAGAVLCWGDRQLTLDHPRIVAAHGEVLAASSLYEDHDCSFDALPVRLDIEDAVRIDLGLRFGCALRASGHVACWGGVPQDLVENLGANEPTDLPSISGAVALATGPNSVCAALADGEIICQGQTSAAGRSRAFDDAPAALVAVDAFDDVYCALSKAGNVRCTSEADGSWEDVIFPEAIERLSGGWAGVCGQDRSGRAWCSGDRNTGLLPGMPYDLPGSVALTAEARRAAEFDGFDLLTMGGSSFHGHTICAVRETGEITCSSQNRNGELLEAAPLNANGDSPERPWISLGLNASAVAVSARSVCIIDALGVACWGTWGEALHCIDGHVPNGPTVPGRYEQRSPVRMLRH
ncbi:MAG: hypothetical protein AAF645_08395 [Myxococcota bacterium]